MVNMIFIVFILYVVIGIYEVKYLQENNLKKDMIIYEILISMSAIITVLQILKINLPHTVMYLIKFAQLIKNIFI